MSDNDIQSSKIVLVEDRADDAKTFIQVIEQAGYESRHFESAKALVEALDTEPPPTIIISGINLPDLNGLEFMRKLQAHPEWCLPAAILMTADPTRDQLLLARKLPVPPEGFLVKPVNPDALKETLHSILERSTPIYLMRRLQRERRSHALKARSKDLVLSARIKETVGTLEEATEERDRLEKERHQTRRAIDRLAGSGEQADLTAKLESLQKQEHELHDKLMELYERRTDLQTQRKRQASELDRVARLLDAQIRTAEDVVRHRAA